MRLLAISFLLFIGGTTGQDADYCNSTEIALQSSSQLHPAEAEVEVLELEPESLMNFEDICVPIAENEESNSTVAEIVRATNEVCTENEIDPGSTPCAARPSPHYGFDASAGECRSFKYTGCGGNENRFAILQECNAVCQDLCSLPIDSGSSSIVFTGEGGREERVDCNQLSGQFFGYMQRAGGCINFRYNGCGGNRNRFETSEECEAICNLATNSSIRGTVTKPPTLAPVTTLTGLADTDEIMMSKWSYAILSSNTTHQGLNDEGCEDEDDLNEKEFCEKFQASYPDSVGTLSVMSRVKSQSISSELLDELDSQVKKDAISSYVSSDASANSRAMAGSVSLKVGSVVANKLFGLLSRPLKHTTVKIFNRESCKKIEITIRVWCVKALVNKPTDAQRDHLCELAKAGIKKHWEVDILNLGGTVDYPVTVTVKESKLLSKKIILKWFDSKPAIPAFLRSFNLGWWWAPMWLKYKGFGAGAAADLQFMETAARAFGRDVLMASGGLVWSWGHEGTSTIFGNTVLATPPVPASPAPINLMWYHEGGDYTNYYERVRATQTQIKDLVKYATFRFSIWWCFGSIGAPCFQNKHCDPPGICSWFRCVLCSKDSQCSADQYCHGLKLPFDVNECKDKRKIGAFCWRDAMCKSGMCDGGRCVECEVDNHCPPGEYCNYNNLPGILNQCTAMKDIGEFCAKDRACKSGFCDGFKCVECEQDHHCPPGQWCEYKNIMFKLNQCSSKKPNGAFCTNDNQCISGMCDGLRCVECEQDYHCASYQYCAHMNLPLVPNKCKAKKSSGFCTRHAMCISNKCRIFGFCKKP